MMSPDTHPFDLAISNLRGAGHFRDALIEVGDTVEMAKKILLQNRVRDFGAADVIALTKMVLEREQLLRERARQDSEDDGEGVL
jgi:hypothetical protein